MPSYKYELQSISAPDFHHGAFEVQKLNPFKKLPDRDYHRHDYFEIVFFGKGGGEHIIDFEASKINSYSAHFVLPGQVHKLERDRTSTGFALLFSEELILKMNNGSSSILNLLFYELKSGNDLIIGKETFEEISNLLEKLLKEQKKKQRDSQICGTYIVLVLLQLNRILREKGKLTPGSVPQKTLLLSFKKLLEENFQNNLKPGDYAFKLNVSTGHLNDILKNALNKTTGELIRERVLMESRRLLFHSELNIHEISHRLGMEDPAYFIRLFKKHMGTTPKEYRQRSRE